MTLAVAKAAVLFFVVTIVQVTIVSSIGILGGSPDLVLVTLVAVALTQGSIFGAASGFWAGRCSTSPGWGRSASRRSS